MNMTMSLTPLVSLLAGILILVVPRLLNYIVAIYLVGLKSEVQHLPGGKVLRWERATST